MGDEGKVTRPKGTGSIVEMRPGYYRVRVFIGRDPVTGGVRQLERRIKGTKREATACWRALQREAEGQRPGSSASLGWLLEEYASHATVRGRAPRTVIEIRRVATKVLPPELCSLSISSLTPRHLDELYRRLATQARPQAPSSIRRHHAVLSAALGQAVKWGWLDRNPAARAEPPAIVEKRIGTLSADDVRLLLREAEAKNPRHAMVMRLAVLTACRLGETCGLRWSDVDPEAGVLHVRRSIYRAGTVRGEKETKGRRERWVALSLPLVEALERWRSICDAEAAALGAAIRPDGFIVSPFPDGSRPVNPETYSAFQSRLAKRLGISLEGRNPFRHFGATEILEATGNPRDGAEVLGHADPAFFLRRYTHAVEGRQRAASAALGRVLEEV